MPDLDEWIPDLWRFSLVDHVRAEYGFIVWRPGTGGNVELTHLRSTQPGGGLRLLKAMLCRLAKDPPYEGKGTVFGFTRVGNVKAREWYSLVGFELTPVVGVYAEGGAVLFSQTYERLCAFHNVMGG